MPYPVELLMESAFHKCLPFARVFSHKADFNARNKCALNKVILITNFERLFPNIIADTMKGFLNSKSEIE